MKRFCIAAMMMFATSEPIFAKTILLSDMLMEYHGTPALFDQNDGTGISDVCGDVANYSYGRAYNGHKGWDRDVPNSGTYMVFAMAAGTIEIMKDGCIEGDLGCNGGAGNYVLINHGNEVKTRYLHLEPYTMKVNEGMWVDRHFPLAQAGSTGNSEGDHVHSEVIVDNEQVDPLELGSQTKVQWMYEPKIDYPTCTINPYTLKEYAADKINEAAEAAGINNPPLKPTHWLNGSNGSDLNDVLIAEYVKNNETWYVAYDLIRNAPQAIATPPKIGNAWKPFVEIGVPIWTPYLYEENGKLYTRLDCRYGYVLAPESNGVVTVHMYPSEIPPGEFAGNNGQLKWKGGFSYAFVKKYVASGGASAMGHANEEGQAWGNAGFVYQPFIEGEMDDCALLAKMNLGNEPYTVHLLHGIFWKKYVSDGGPDFFGIPLGDSYFDAFFGMLRQDFENGKSIFEDGSIVSSSSKCLYANVEAYDSCACPGTSKVDDCGNCGAQEFICQAYTWKPLGSCANQGICTPGETKTSLCECGGTKVMICNESCEWSAWGPCGDFKGIESCNGKDDDCDSLTDENVTISCSVACGKGTQTCKAGVFLPCSSNKWPTEICNGKDDDCDGVIDDGLNCCTPQAEICDGKDNDCDGQADEENICCKQNVETCNGKDDNCDGITDEGLTNACGGCEKLPAQPYAICGQNAWYICDTQNSLFCWYAFFGDPPPPPDPDPEPDPPPEEDPPPPPPSSCGECSPGASESKKCDPGTYCASGTKTRTCTSSCSWGSWGSCSAASGPKYGYEGGTKCGSMICIAIMNSDENSITVSISKAGGGAFSSNPSEWKLVTESGATVKVAPGAGCEAYYGGQTSFVASFDPSKYSLDEDGVKVKFWSGQNCSDLYESGYAYFSTCK